MSGCASDPPVLVRTELVQVPVEVAKPLPPRLTDPIDYPTLNSEYTESDLYDLIYALIDRLDQANLDRASVKELAK